MERESEPAARRSFCCHDEVMRRSGTGTFVRVSGVESKTRSGHEEGQVLMQLMVARFRVIYKIYKTKNIVNMPVVPPTGLSMPL